MRGPDLDLRPERRERIVDELRRALAAAINGSTFVLRGSLADGTADRYSDIDGVWVVPSQSLRRAVEALGHTLNAIGDVDSIRADPEASSQHRCLLFVAFSDLPVFWRFDLEVVADADSPVVTVAAAESRAIPDAGWSLPASALANAVAAIKAVSRGRIEDARGLLGRAYPRVNQSYESSGSWRSDIVGLTQHVVAAEPSLAARAEQVRLVAEALLPQ